MLWKKFADETCETYTKSNNCEIGACCDYGDGKYYKFRHTETEGEMKVTKYTDNECNFYYWDEPRTYSYIETDSDCLAAPEEEGVYY